MRPASDAGERFLRADRAVVIGEALELAVGAFAYEAELRRALARLKYGRVPRLADPLATAAAPAMRAVLHGFGDATLVPVPVHPERLRDRGYNQAALLARALGRRCGRPVADVLERRRPTEKQHRLNRAARLRNLAGAFAVREHAEAPRHALLVDDILTTSATLEACGAVLVAAGAERVRGFTIAREL